MALAVEKGTITSPGSTGNQTTDLIDTGFGLVKALVLWVTNATAEQDTDGSALMNIGFGTYRGSVVQQWTSGCGFTDAVAAGECHRVSATAQIIRWPLVGTTTEDMAIALVSLDTAQFVLNWTNLPTIPSLKVHYMALGGTDITDALVDNVSIPNATGTFDETVVAGFGKPDLLIATVGHASAAIFDSDAIWGLGLGVDDTQQATVSLYNDDGAATISLSQSNENDEFMNFTATAASTNRQVVLTAKASWPTDGFQCDNVAFSTASLMGYLALRGTFTAKVGANTVPIAGGLPVTQDLAVGATPRGALFFHTNTVGTDHTATDADLGLIGIGGMDGTREGHASIGDNDGAADSETHFHHSESKTLRFHTPGAAGTLTSEADGLFSGNNVQLSWTDIDSVERQYVYLLLGDAAASLIYRPRPMIRNI